MCTDLLKANLLLNLFFGYCRMPKIEGGKFLGSGRAFVDVNKFFSQQKMKVKKKSNPTIPFDKG